MYYVNTVMVGHRKGASTCPSIKWKYCQQVCQQPHANQSALACKFCHFKAKQATFSAFRTYFIIGFLGECQNVLYIVLLYKYFIWKNSSEKSDIILLGTAFWNKNGCFIQTFLGLVQGRFSGPSPQSHGSYAIQLCQHQPKLSLPQNNSFPERTATFSHCFRTLQHPNHPPL